MDVFFRLLAQSLDCACLKTATPGVRGAHARLAAHLLRELSPERDEHTNTIVLAAIRRSLDQFGVVATLSRGLWLVSNDEARLHVAFWRLADAAFQEGHVSALSELLQLLALMGRGRETPPDEWARMAVESNRLYGAAPGGVLLITRWMKAFDHVPPWLRDRIQTGPAVLHLLSGDVTRKIHRRAPTAATWRELARHRIFPTSRVAPNVDARVHELALEELGLAIHLQPAGTERSTLEQWLAELTK